MLSTKPSSEVLVFLFINRREHKKSGSGSRASYHAPLTPTLNHKRRVERPIRVGERGTHVNQLVIKCRTVV